MMGKGNTDRNTMNDQSTNWISDWQIDVFSNFLIYSTELINQIWNYFSNPILRPTSTLFEQPLNSSFITLCWKLKILNLNFENGRDKIILLTMILIQLDAGEIHVADVVAVGGGGVAVVVRDGCRAVTIWIGLIIFSWLLYNWSLVNDHSSDGRQIKIHLEDFRYLQGNVNDGGYLQGNHEENVARPERVVS